MTGEPRPAVFRMPERLFAELAAGGGAVEAVSFLARAERARRLLLLRTLLDRLAGVPTPLAAPAEAWSVLKEAAERVPEAVEGLLAAPATGGWIAHMLRRLHGTATGPPLWAEAGHLNLLALTATLHAGLETTLEVPLTDGTVYLPALGQARLPQAEPGLTVALAATTSRGELTLSAQRRDGSPTTMTCRPATTPATAPATTRPVPPTGPPTPSASASVGPCAPSASGSPGSSAPPESGSLDPPAPSASGCLRSSVSPASGSVGPPSVPSASGSPAPSASGSPGPSVPPGPGSLAPSDEPSDAAGPVTTTDASLRPAPTAASPPARPAPPERAPTDARRVSSATAATPSAVRPVTPARGATSPTPGPPSPGPGRVPEPHTPGPAAPAGDADGPSWLPLRTLTHTTPAGPVAIPLDDLGPYRDLDDPVPPARLHAGEAAEWQRVFDGAVAILAGAGGGQGPGRLDPALIRAVVPYGRTAPTPPAPPSVAVSASSGDSFGAMLISRPASALALAETLVHEFQHSKLAALLHLFPLLDDDREERYYAPWRADPRHLTGLLHGAYAFTGVAGFWRDRFEEPEHAEAAAYHFALRRLQSRLVVRTLLTSARLTPPGRRLVEGLARTLDGWLRVPVDPAALTRARTAAALHRTQWRLRNVAVPPGPDGTLRFRPDRGFWPDPRTHAFATRPVAPRTPDEHLAAGDPATALAGYAGGLARDPADPHALSGWIVARAALDPGHLTRRPLARPELLQPQPSG
ncbi:aKG-HExxH-type peptide beta-hydroxylase [Streptomyces pactum]|uniref:aKG-HExxH-type peptide beta-hydroxylase n=1 Tax=Streptomyces pactum TaxID=68249 RepID=UPI000ADEDBD7|nr:HEXXH motif-containing putative peptide modification protein [Streptomyces pactum]